MLISVSKNDPGSQEAYIDILMQHIDIKTPYSTCIKMLIY